MIKGSKAGNDIAGTWYYTHGSIADSVPFQVGGKLFKAKQSIFDLKIGRDYLADTGILKFKYVKIQCRESRNRFKT